MTTENRGAPLERGVRSTTAAPAIPRTIRPKSYQDMATRPPPAFQTYASDISARFEYIDAGLAERGLLLSMMLFYWVNDRLPADRRRIAHFLCVSPDDMEAAYSDLVKHYFEPIHGNEEFLCCPDLDLQKAAHLERAKKQADGGRKGGLRTQQRNRDAFDSRGATSSHSRVARGSAKAPEMSRAERSGVERVEKKLASGEHEFADDDEWRRAAFADESGFA